MTAPPPPEVAAGTVAPTAQQIEALDFLRGTALFGILFMNINGASLPAAYANPANWGVAEGANLWVWIVAEVGFEGTQRALFTILFGARVILFTSRMPGHRAARPWRSVGQHPLQSASQPSGRFRPGRRSTCGGRLAEVEQQRIVPQSIGRPLAHRAC